MPTITEEIEPDRIIVTLPLSSQNSDDKTVTINGDGKKATINEERQKNSIIEYLTDHPEGAVSDFEMLLGVKSTRVKQILYKLLKDDVIEALGANKNRRYRLKG